MRVEIDGGKAATSGKRERSCSKQTGARKGKLQSESRAD